MDSWDSEYAKAENRNNPSVLNSTFSSVDSPNLSKDSIESLEDQSDKTKPTFKSALQAKKRLQAYSAANKFKKLYSKDEKCEEVTEKLDKASSKKLKKAMYHDEKAKAVIQEIEGIKKAEALREYAKEKQLLEAKVTIHSMAANYRIRSRSRSLSPGFKKRDIKCKNIRRSDTLNKKSPSPEEPDKKPNKDKEEKKPSVRKQYPKNWTEYKEQNLTFEKDAQLKNKLFDKQKNRIELANFFNFETPSPLLRFFECKMDNGQRTNIPFCYLRRTHSIPNITYSSNFRMIEEDFIKRQQLFRLIPKERQEIIERIITSKTKCQPSNKKLVTRQWYPKNWKKFDNSEGKLLENSVGLSFLQTYSDEEEEEIENIEEENDLPTQKDGLSMPLEDLEDLNKGTTPEIQNHIPNEDELDKTRREIEELEISLKEAQECELSMVEEKKKKVKIPKKKKDESLSEEEPEHPKKKRQKKKSKKKKREEESSSSESEDEEMEIARKKRKKKKLLKQKLEKKSRKEKKVERKKKKSNKYEEESSEDDNKKKKKKVKSREFEEALEEPQEKKNKKKSENPEKGTGKSWTDEDIEEREIIPKKNKNKLSGEGIEVIDTSSEDKNKEIILDVKTRKKPKKNRWGSVEKKVEIINMDEFVENLQLSQNDHNKPKIKAAPNEGEFLKSFESIEELKPEEHIQTEIQQLKEQMTPERNKKIETVFLEKINEEKDNENSHKKINEEEGNENSHKNEEILKEDKKKHKNLEEDKTKSSKDIEEIHHKEDKERNPGENKEGKIENAEETTSKRDNAKDRNETPKRRRDSDKTEKSSRQLEHVEETTSRKDSVKDQNESLKNRRDSEKINRSCGEKHKEYHEDPSKRNRYSERFEEKGSERSRRHSEKSNYDDRRRKYSESKDHSMRHQKDEGRDRRYSQNESTLKGRHIEKEEKHGEKHHEEVSHGKKLEGLDHKIERSRNYDEKPPEKCRDLRERLREKELSKERKYEEKETEKSRRDRISRKIRHSDKSEIIAETKNKEKYPIITAHFIDLTQVKVKEEPDWEKIKSKRKRHISDTDSDRKKYKNQVDDLENISLPDEEFEAFPLEKDKVSSGELSLKMKIKEEKVDRHFRQYHEWEREPTWEEYDDRTCLPPREKLNSSWESDEEIFERSFQQMEEHRGSSFNNSFDLEIPLNIKPFKKREFDVHSDVIDADTELIILKRQSRNLSEERRKLEIEKMRVKELELKMLKEAEDKKEDACKLKRRRSREGMQDISYDWEVEVVEKKKGRWDDQRMSTPKIDLTKVKKEKVDEDYSFDNNSSTNLSNNSVAVLENEYEEFMKAVTSAPEKEKKKNKKREESSSSESSSSESSDSDSSSSTSSREVVKKKKKKETENKAEKPIPDIESKKEAQKEIPNIEANIEKAIVTNLDELMPKPIDIPVPKIDTVLPIPLPPTTPTKEIKPVPVPSPLFDIKKPMINLSLSTNITQNITLNLSSSLAKISSPISKNIDIVNPTVISSPIIKNVDVSPVDVSLPTKPVETPVMPKLDKTMSPVVKNIKNDATNYASPSLTDISMDSFTFEDKDCDKKSEKPFVFTSMVIPTKKLIDNSNLNLDDSDDDESAKLEEIKKKKLEALIQENLKEKQAEGGLNEPVRVKEEIKTERRRSKSPANRKSKSPVNRRSKSPANRGRERTVRKSPPRSRKEPSPKKRHPSDLSRRREPSPRRLSPRRRSPVQRRSSPRRRSISPRRRSPFGRRRSPGRRRTPSPKRRSPSPRRRRSISPKRRRSLSPRLRRSKSPVRRNTERSKSPLTHASPFDGLKRSVADSTISDDLLPQSTTHDEYVESPMSRFYDKYKNQDYDSPKRIPLDVRINQVLGISLPPEPPKPITTTYGNYSYDENKQYSETATHYSNYEKNSSFGTVVSNKNAAYPAHSPYMTSTPVATGTKSRPINKLRQAGCFKQVGNMLQIVPTEDVLSVTPKEKKTTVIPEKTQIVQVGNMLQIVPTENIPIPSLPHPDIKEEVMEISTPEKNSSQILVNEVPQEKQSAEAGMKQKVSERRAEREKRKQEREKRRKEKERRKKEKEKQRQLKLKLRTENMIKKALELEVEGGEEEPEEDLDETPTQWPPLPLAVAYNSKETKKSILIRAGFSKSEGELDRKKVVQFADGVKPGEGTSPSGGEELSSPPPASRKKLPKEKRYKKSRLTKKGQKKKVKVKIIKKRQQDSEDSDDDENLPPPSPPPGSPPPHIFPPRIKTHTINNVQPAYLPNIVQNTQYQQLYRPPINLIMAPPPPPHHHGPPPPSGPPHHHGGPPPPPIHHHHGLPPSPHHPPPPPGPIHLGPPPPPPGHHGPPPSHHLGHHHHHLH